MQELSRIQHGEYALEEKVKSCRCAMEEKVAEMKNSLNTFKVRTAAMPCPPGLDSTLNRMEEPF